MSIDFLAADIAAAETLFDALGQPVEYHRDGGVISSIQAIIDKDVEFWPGGFEAVVAERRIEISILKGDVDKPKRGEMVVASDVTYQVEDVLFDDGVEVRVSAKLQ